MRIIGGCARGRRLKTRKGSETRPTADRVKESLFNMLAADIVDCRFLDVFAGNGGIGLEALSRGARHCIFIEKNRECATIIKGNLTACGLADRATVLVADAGTAVQTLVGKKTLFDILFFDPPYGSPQLATVLSSAAKLVASGGYAVVEHARGDLSWHNIQEWEYIRQKVYGDTALSFIAPAAAAEDMAEHEKREE